MPETDEATEMNERTGVIMRRISQLDRASVGQVSYIRSRPVEAVALHWDGSAEAANAIALVCEKDVSFYRRVAGIEVGDEYMISVETNNGTVGVEVGCWLIWSGSDWYPCDAATFERRWEQVLAS